MKKKNNDHNHVITRRLYLKKSSFKLSPQRTPTKRQHWRISHQLLANHTIKNWPYLYIPLPLSQPHNHIIEDSSWNRNVQQNYVFASPCTGEPSLENHTVSGSSNNTWDRTKTKAMAAKSYAITASIEASVCRNCDNLK